MCMMFASANAFQWNQPLSYPSHWLRVTPVKRTTPQQSGRATCTQATANCSGVQGTAASTYPQDTAAGEDPNKNNHPTYNAQLISTGCATASCLCLA
jgi:hypothetical protein